MEWTSFDVTNKIRVHLRYRHNIPKIKVGHAGTLDPLATGLLLVCVGHTTRQIISLQDMEKTYTGTILLGSSTPSFDAETPVTKVMPVDHISPEMIRQAAADLTGEIMQVPPLYSAVKQGGVRAYAMARKNREVTLLPRPITIHRFDITRIEGLLIGFEITCSKGTYIRSVARDLGAALGTCAYLTELRRTRIGYYNVSDAYTPEQLDEAFNEIFKKFIR